MDIQTSCFLMHCLLDMEEPLIHEKKNAET